MRGWVVRLRALPLRMKVMITVIGGALALLGVSTYLSFRYWKGEALVVAEQQARLAGAAVRGPVEAALAAGQVDDARRSLRQLVEKGYISEARVFAPDGRVLVSSVPAEEGRRHRTLWLPRGRLVPQEGLVRHDDAAERVEAFLPLALPDVVLLEVAFPLGPLRSALDRGLKVGLALVVASLLAMAALFSTMIEREVVAPMRRVAVLLGEREEHGAPPPADEFRGLARSVAELIEKERAAEELAETQRRQIEAQAGLAQVGEMAAEMAHEFKRPLTSIRTALELMTQEYALDERGERLFGSVQLQLDKLSETMRDLFALARPIEVAREPVDLRRVVDGALMQLAAHPSLQRVQVRREYSGEALVCGDAHRLEQVVLNLGLNSAEAMPEGGKLTVRVRAQEGRVRLEVADTGVGIPADKIEQVFSPFYSTKPTGTGLGLSLVARIVAAHNGRLQVDSEPGRGTTISVELPVAQPAAATPEEQGASWQMPAS